MSPLYDVPRDATPTTHGLVVALVLAAVVMAGLFTLGRGPAGNRIAPGPVIYEYEVPVPDEPPEPTRPAAVPGSARWGECASDASHQGIEDSYLISALESAADDDPLFGLTERGMGAAECAARRWRETGDLWLAYRPGQ